MSDDEQEPHKMEQVRLINPREADRAAVERNVVSYVESIPGVVLEYYKALPDSYQGRYVSADLMKETFGEYAASREARNRYNNVVHNSAAVLASAQFSDTIRDRSDAARNDALFITGAPGAGKTSSVLENGVPDNARIVYEGQLIDKSSHDKIAAAIGEGLNVKITAVLPKIETALENTSRRFENVGRGASMATMARIHEETPEGLAVIQERFGNRVLIEVVDSRDPAKTVSLNFAEGVIQWKQEIERGPAIERLHAHLDVMRREGRTTPDFELQARGKVPELGREHSSINLQIGDQSGRTSEDRKAGILKPLQGLELERAQENAVKFRTAPQAERLADPKLNGAAKVLAVLNAHIDAAHKPGSQENQKAKDIAVNVLAANIAKGRVYDAPKVVRTAPGRADEIKIPDKSREKTPER